MKRTILLVAAIAMITAVVRAKDGPEIDPELSKVVDPLIKQLDSASFEEREAATLELMKLGPTAEPALRAAENHRSIEVRSRVRKVLLHYKEILRQASLGDPAEKDWPMLKRGPGRNASDGLGGVRREPKIRWARELPFEVGYPYFDSPLFSVGDRLLLVGRGGDVASISREDGSIVWAASTDEPILAGPVMAGGVIFIPGQSLTAMDGRTGRVLWRWETDYGCSASPLAYGGRVFAVEKGEKIVALDPATGEEVWKMRIPATTSAPVAVGDLIVVGTEKGVIAFRASDGQRRWTFESAAAVTSSPAVLPDRIVVGDRERNVYALSADRGREIWRRTIPEGVLRETPAVYGDAVLFSTSGATFRALRAADGKDLWTRFVGTMVVSSPCVSGGIAYFTAGPRIHAMFCADGDDVWRLQYVSIWSSPILVDGSLFVVTVDGVLLALK